MATGFRNDLSDMFFNDQLSMDSLFDGDLNHEINRNRDKSTIKRPKPNLTCVVCGDNAFGYNFDAVSCESCKAFFRRNALRPPGKLKCRGNGNCEVTVEKRKRCKKCRLDKCFRMGLRKEWILSEDEKRRKRSKVEENRIVKQSHGRTYKCRRGNIKPSKVEESLPGDEFQPSLPDDISLMTTSDWAKINEVQLAYSQSITLNKVIGVPPYPATQHIDSTIELIRIPAYLASIRLISFIKLIPEFNLFDPEDRVALVKYNLLAAVFMHIVLLYDPIADTYHEHNTEDPIFAGKDWIRILGEEFYRESTAVVTKLIEIVQYDRVIIKIFLLLILSSKGFCGYDISNEPTLNNHLIVLNTQNTYLESLYKYCLHHYGLNKTVIIFSRTLNQLFAIQRLAVYLKDCVHEHVEASQLSPLMQNVLHFSDSN